MARKYHVSKQEQNQSREPNENSDGELIDVNDELRNSNFE